MRFDDLAVELVCPYCGADPTFWCVTSSGALASRLHEGRTAPVRNVWREGFDEGLAEGAFGIIGKIERRGLGILPDQETIMLEVIREWARGWGVKEFVT